MADVVDPLTRSRMMSGIRGKDTKPELALRSALHRRGFRFRLHASHLPGKPDLVFPGRNAIVLVHGCFWHRHHRCRFTTTPATRPEFWKAKFQDNVERDKRTLVALRSLGWRVHVVWECEIRRDLAAVVENLSTWLEASRGS
ncbi:MAG: DNA mismatch endonuclease Vsr [Verrucomicrobiaceae bacterium]|nr:MAG: DNA mismatch endonuclease Vsr [Verrucomicrobiaceae bacterium]